MAEQAPEGGPREAARAGGEHARAAHEPVDTKPRAMRGVLIGAGLSALLWAGLIALGRWLLGTLR